jgi:anti-sigma-K factor RskA
MREEEEIDGTAAEYALGSLDPVERSQVDADRNIDTALADAIVAWERRLGPLNALLPGVEPPAHAIDGILARISEQVAKPESSAELVPLPHKLWRQSVLVVGASSLAACLAVAAGLFIYSLPEMETPHVARMDCGGLYKDFWVAFDREKYASLSTDRLAGVSRMALRAYDACQAGDERDAESLFLHLHRTN